MMHPRRSARTRALFESLESRRLLTVINWVNRGPNDGFATFLGANAEAGRKVVDAAFAAITRSITALNNVGSGTGSGTPPNQIDVTITMVDLPDGANGRTTQVFGAGGKPFKGTIELDDKNGNWFLDPTPNEHSEFLGETLNAFVARAPDGAAHENQFDLYSVAIHEMMHVLGLAGPGSLDLNRLPSDVLFPSPTAVDPDLWTYNGNAIDLLLTQHNGGTGGGVVGRPAHFGVGTSDPSAAFPNGLTQGSDVAQETFSRGQRYLFSNLDRLFLQDVYAYTTVDPTQFGTMYAVVNSNKKLTVRTLDGNPGIDNISLTRDTNGELIVSVDIANDKLPNGTQLPAFVTRFKQLDVASIEVLGSDGSDQLIIGANIGVPIAYNAGDGSDNFVIDGTAGADTATLSNSTFTGVGNNITYTGVSSASIRLFGGADVFNINGRPNSMLLFGGDDDDTFNMAPAAKNLNGVIGGLNSVIRGERGNDIVDFQDLNGTLDHTVDILPDRINRDGLGTRLETVEQVSYTGGRGVDVVNVDQAAPVYRLNLALTGPGLNTLNINDQTATAARTYALDGLSITRGGLGLITTSATQTLNINGTPFADTFNVTKVVDNTSMTIRAGAGNDFALLKGPGGLDEMRGSFRLIGESGVDTIEMNDVDTLREGKAYTLTGVQLIRGTLVGPTDIRFAGTSFGEATENVKLVTTRFADTISVSGNIFSKTSVDALAGDDVITASGFVPVTLMGGLNNDSITGADGNDSLNGGDGVDTLVGGNGNDTMDGGPGDDSLLGGNGNDTAVLSAAGGNDSIDLGPQTDGVVLHGTDGDDEIFVARRVLNGVPQVIYKLNGRSIVSNYRNGETVTVFGRRGNDRIVMEFGAGVTWKANFFGEHGNDILIGSHKNDNLDGGPGDDLLEGLGGEDVLNGGKGRDTFRGGDGPDWIFANDQEIDVITNDPKDRRQVDPLIELFV